MLQSAIFADLQVNSFGIPTVRFAPTESMVELARDSFASFRDWLRDLVPTDDVAQLNSHLRRDIGLAD